MESTASAKRLDGIIEGAMAEENAKCAERVSQHMQHGEATDIEINGDLLRHHKARSTPYAHSIRNMIRHQNFLKYLREAGPGGLGNPVYYRQQLAGSGLIPMVAAYAVFSALDLFRKSMGLGRCSIGFPI